jgi:hypothetical protein
MPGYPEVVRRYYYHYSTHSDVVDAITKNFGVTVCECVKWVILH